MLAYGPFIKSYEEPWSTMVAFREMLSLIIRKVYLLIKVFHI